MAKSFFFLILSICYEEFMFHKYRKDSVHLRTAIFQTYKEKCMYCGRIIQQRDLCIDHILPVNLQIQTNQDVIDYLEELQAKGFIEDSIENYLPCCAACNTTKSNTVYQVSSLRYYHELAHKNVDRILKLIREQKNDDTCYEPINPKTWEKIDFKNQHDLSYAIMGYRLTSHDVEACPRIHQVSSIKKQLEIVDYIIVSGESGCGKSISAYQASYDYYKDSWQIYRLKASEKIDTVELPCNTEKSLYLIDDAQLISEQIIESIIFQARANAKVIICKTLGLTINDETIIVSRKEAVEVLYEYYRQNTKTIIPIVQKYDNSIGTSLTDQPIEYRLLRAKEATTPWQFNYVLRGGWQTMKERYKETCRNNNLDLLVAAIATSQIAKMDYSSDFDWICNELKKIDPSLCWTNDVLIELKNKAIILSETDVRIVHIESANIIVTLFLEEGIKEKQEFLLHFIENSYIGGTFSPLGIVWLVNGINRHSRLRNTYTRFITERMIDNTLDDISTYLSPTIRAQVALFWEMIYRVWKKKHAIYLEKHEKELIDWFEHTNSQTAYAYSELLNTLRNNDVTQHKEISLKINLSKIIISLLEEQTPDLYVWGKFFNRLFCSLNQKESLVIGEQLQSLIEYFSTRATVINIHDLTSFFCSLIYTNEQSIRKAIEQIIPIYSDYFKKDMLKAIELFDFEFLEYVCGMDFFGLHRATAQQKETARLIVAAIPEKPMSIALSKCTPKDWHSIRPIMHIIEKNDPEKAKRIIRQVDLDQLSENAIMSWRRCHEITELCDILSMGDISIAKYFIIMNKTHICILYSAFIIISPQTAIQMIKADCEIELITEHWWDLGLRALKRIKSIDEKAFNLLLQKCTPNLIQSINSITKLDLNERYCVDFLQYIKNNAPVYYNMIINKIDKDHIKKNWNNGTVYSQRKKQAEERERRIITLLNYI